MIIQTIKDYFSKKEKGEITAKAPEGICPVCWGHDEWDDHYYKIIKEKHVLSNSSTYESFISKIADKYVNTTRKSGDEYICLTCNNKITTGNKD